MKKAKKNRIGEQRGKTEEYPGKNNSKTANQLVKDLTTVKSKTRSGKSLTEEREIGNQWTEYCSGTVQ